MCAMIRNGEVRLPDEVFEPLDDHYARRELYRSPEHGYSVVAMTWAPGQATPIHDHCGLWCVEGVGDGDLEINPYALLERDSSEEPRGGQECSSTGNSRGSRSHKKKKNK